MRGRYEFKKQEFRKQESYVVHEEGDREFNHYPMYDQGYHHATFEKPPFQSETHGYLGDQHNDMVFNENGPRGWNGTLLKKNAHHPSGANTILRPPLGSVRQGISQYNGHASTEGRREVENRKGGWNYVGPDVVEDGYLGRGTKEASRMIDYNQMEGYGRYGGGKAKFVDYDTELGEDLDTLISRLESGQGGRVKKIELIKYERYSGVDLAGKQEWRMLGGSAPKYYNNPPWARGY